MNALQKNPETGFLESYSTALASFDSPKKLKFLELAKEHFEKTGEWPEIDSLCKAVDIAPRTFDRHIKSDEAFAEAWKDIKLPAKWKLESMMYRLGSKNPMYMFGWLRKEFPEEYDPEKKIIHLTNMSEQKAISGRISEYLDAEIVEKKD